jgi:hypothetical protein
MKRDKAEQIIQNALAGYIEDCAGTNYPEAKLIEKAWNSIRLEAPTHKVVKKKICHNCDGMELELDEECADCGRSN